MSKHYRTETNCLNCGNNVDGKFCSNCGQENIDVKESFWTFVSHGVGHYFHYDSKFQKTLKPFLTRPGQLTKDYIEGQRARHIPPISLYLFITLIYFVFAPIFKDKKENTTSFNYKYNQETGDFEKTKSRSEREAEEDSILAADSTIESYRYRQSNLPIGQRDNRFDRFWQELYISYKQKTGRDLDIGNMLDKNFPKLLFVLMPLFAFFLMLNFRKNKKLYLEHLIYTIHLFSFAFLSFFVSELLIYLTPPQIGVNVGVIFFGILIWYTYRSIRVVYERSRWVSVRKLFSVSILFLLAFMITYVLGIVTIIALI